MSSYFADSSVNSQTVIGSSSAQPEKPHILFYEISDNSSTESHNLYFDNKKGYDIELPESEFYEFSFIRDNKDTFTLEKSINSALKKLPNNYHFNQRIINRLLDLIDTDEDEDWEEKPSLGSIKYFIGFINVYKPKYPDIVISPQGNAKVEWHKNNNNLFTLEFFPDGSCKFLHFYSDTHNSERVNRIGGQITVNTLADYFQQEKIKKLVLK